MGRWLDKIATNTLNEPTQQTQPTSVSCVGSYNSLIDKFVIEACYGLEVSTAIIIDNLLSVDDESDIINGDLSKEQLRAFVKLWLSTGAKKVSGK